MLGMSLDLFYMILLQSEALNLKDNAQWTNPHELSQKRNDAFPPTA